MGKNVSAPLLRTARLLDLVPFLNTHQGIALKELAAHFDVTPAQMSAEEIEAQVKAIIAETGAAGMKDLGKVMPAAMKAMGGVADGKLISEAVKKLLA